MKRFKGLAAFRREIISKEKLAYAIVISGVNRARKETLEERQIREARYLELKELWKKPPFSTKEKA